MHATRLSTAARAVTALCTAHWAAFLVAFLAGASYVFLILLAFLAVER